MFELNAASENGFGSGTKFGFPLPLLVVGHSLAYAFGRISGAPTVSKVLETQK